MDYLQFILSVFTVMTPIIVAVGYIMKRYADGRYSAIMTHQKELEAQTAQSISSAKAFESMSNTLIAMVGGYREGTLATKENTAALQNMSVVLADQDLRTGLFYRDFTGAVKTFAEDITQRVQSLQATTGDPVASLLKRLDEILPKLEVLPGKIDTVLIEVQAIPRIEEGQRNTVVAMLQREIKAAAERVLTEITKLDGMLIEISRVKGQYEYIRENVSETQMERAARVALNINQSPPALSTEGESKSEHKSIEKEESTS